jgi:hypothetical protein
MGKSPVAALADGQKRDESEECFRHCFAASILGRRVHAPRPVCHAVHGVVRQAHVSTEEESM